jgi:hypothetical protein
MAAPPCSCGTKAFSRQKTNSGQRRPKVTRRLRPVLQDSRVGHPDIPRESLESRLAAARSFDEIEVEAGLKKSDS